MTIKSIVFDIGGVLLRSEDESGRIKLGEKYNLQPGWVEKLVFNSPAAQASSIGLVETDAIWQNVAEYLSLTKSALKEFIYQFWQGDRIDYNLIKFLQNCRQKFKTALLTNAWMGARSDLLERYAIIEGETVDHILISSEIGIAKPDPRIYQLLGEVLECHLHEILFVDDFIENILAAEELGIHAIHFQVGMELINEIESRINKLINTR